MDPQSLPDPNAVARQIRATLSCAPCLGIELGSGFSSVVEALHLECAWNFTDLPGFPPVSVRGHTGSLMIGHWEGVPVAVLNGRAHYYEGLDLAAITFPIRVLSALGVNSLLFTNAAGAIRPGFRPGDFMALSDHINLLGMNPLRGPETLGGNRFVDMTTAYDPGLRKLLRQAARKAGQRLHEGVYLAVSGPSYETPAEIRAFRCWGADAVGMSTVPGVIVARKCGLRVAALSCLTNLAAGLGPKGQGIDHQTDVLAPAQARSAAIITLLGGFIRRWAMSSPELAMPPAIAARHSPVGSSRRLRADSKSGLRFGTQSPSSAKSGRAAKGRPRS